MASLALALCAGSYGLHKLPEHLESETGLLLIHRPFAPMPSCPQLSLPTPDTHERVHYGYGYGCGAVRRERCGALHLGTRHLQAQVGRFNSQPPTKEDSVLGLTAWNTQLQISTIALH